MHDDAIALTRRLIAIPSTSGNERDILAYLHGWLTDNGFTDIRLTDKFCAGRLDLPKRAQALICCGHIDTVVPGDAAGWKHHPFSPVIEGDKLYGLGGTDMKSGLAAQMAAAVSLLDGSSAKPAADIWIAAVTDEETDGSGAAAFVEWFRTSHHYDKTSCLIAEPTDLERIEVGHRGNRFVGLKFSGESGHASQQESYAASALYKAQVFLAALPDIVTKVQQDFSDPLLGAPTIVPTGLQSGDPLSPNKTSGTASLTLDTRTTPQFEATFEPWLSLVGEQFGFSWQYLMDFANSSQCDPEAGLVGSVQDATGIGSLSASKGATDQLFFQSAGIDTVVFGPGEFGLAHTQDEYVSLTKVRKACDIYRTVYLSLGDSL